jgi:predicted nucleic acid-binding protein
MQFDTDVLIWAQRGNAKAIRLIDDTPQRCISIQTYMELLQGAQNKEQHRIIRSFVKDFDFMVLPFTENIGHRALIYVEAHTLSSSMRAGDAVIAATAVENNLVLASGNQKHFKPVKELQLKLFRP